MWTELGLNIDNIEDLGNFLNGYRSRHKYANGIKLKLQIDGNTISTENGVVGVGFLNDKWVNLESYGKKLSHNGDYFTRLSFMYDKKTYDAKFEKGGNVKVIGVKSTPKSKFIGICGGIAGGVALVAGLSLMLLKRKK